VIIVVVVVSLVMYRREGMQKWTLKLVSTTAALNEYSYISVIPIT
jgi:hypothetical protein